MNLDIYTINVNKLLKSIYNYEGYASLIKTTIRQVYADYSKALKEIMEYKNLTFHSIPATNHYIDSLKNYGECEKFYKSKLFCDYIKGTGLTPEIVIQKIKDKNGYQE